MKDKSLTYKLLFSVACGLLVAGCENKSGEESYAEIAVTNSYLACAVRQLCGDDTEVLCLAPPGMCPGHFDISPLQVKQLCGCRILLLFDFQKQVEGTMSRMKERGLKTALVKEAGGLCVPETYIAVCREISDILSSEYPEKNIRYQQKLAIIEKDMKHLQDELLEKVAQGGVSSAKVLASNHQADFVKWLGLETIETFVGSDIETVAGIDDCIKKAKGQDVRFVIANKQEGTALAKALAERLGAKAVVFSNFPEFSDDASGFSALLRANVNALLEAARL
jgi:ABC-type Zn uptake system ZnuABC Zn-binding protein ZnuA